MGHSFHPPPYAQGGFESYSGDIRPGDWKCPSCSGHNYADKKACFKCGVEKPATVKEMGRGMQFSRGNFSGRNFEDRRPGDWDCPSCNAHNFASKTACFVCDKPKPKDAGNTGNSRSYRGDRRPGDWDCPECQAHNYADKIACFRCKVKKPEES